MRDPAGLWSIGIRVWGGSERKVPVRIVPVPLRGFCGLILGDLGT